MFAYVDLNVDLDRGRPHTGDRGYPRTGGQDPGVAKKAHVEKKQARTTEDSPKIYSPAQRFSMFTVVQPACEF